MANCVTCKAKCENAGKHRVTAYCISYVPKDYPKPQTNADRIRAMTDEELAKKISKLESFVLTYGGEWSADKWLDWLRQEADND